MTPDPIALPQEFAEPRRSRASGSASSRIASSGTPKSVRRMTSLATFAEQAVERRTRGARRSADGGPGAPWAELGVAAGRRHLRVGDIATLCRSGTIGDDCRRCCGDRWHRVGNRSLHARKMAERRARQRPQARRDSRGRHRQSRCPRHRHQRAAGRVSSGCRAACNVDRGRTRSFRRSRSRPRRVSRRARLALS